MFFAQKARWPDREPSMIVFSRSISPVAAVALLKVRFLTVFVKLLTGNLRPRTETA